MPGTARSNDLHVKTHVPVSLQQFSLSVFSFNCQGGKSTIKWRLLAAAVGIALFTVVLADAVRAGEPDPHLIYTETIGQFTITNLAFGPVGPHCSASKGGAACAFTTVDFTITANTVPLGPSTSKGTFTTLYGVNGAFLFPSGAHDASGNPTGFCAPGSGTSTDTYPDGSTISSNLQGLNCCASDSCTTGIHLGPPSIISFSTVITGGTGRFAGAAGGVSGNDSHNSASGPMLAHSEGVLELLGNPD
jgi:hypothetical protein